MSRIIMQPSGKSVECAYGDTVLMALEKAGYALVCTRPAYDGRMRRYYKRTLDEQSGRP